MFTKITIKNNDYILRLNTRASIALEKALGRSPLAVFMDLDKGEMPKLQDMLLILHAALQPMNHKISLDATYDLFDDYAEEGNNIFDLVPIFIELFQECGYLAKSAGDSAEEAEGKN